MINKILALIHKLIKKHFKLPVVCSAEKRTLFGVVSGSDDITSFSDE